MSQRGDGSSQELYFWTSRLCWAQRCPTGDEEAARIPGEGLPFIRKKGCLFLTHTKECSGLGEALSLLEDGWEKLPPFPVPPVSLALSPACFLRRQEWGTYSQFEDGCSPP